VVWPQAHTYLPLRCVAKCLGDFPRTGLFGFKQGLFGFKQGLFGFKQWLLGLGSGSAEVVADPLEPPRPSKFFSQVR
jgi:hypothetical protein